MNKKFLDILSEAIDNDTLIIVILGAIAAVDIIVNKGKPFLARDIALLLGGYIGATVKNRLGAS